MIEPARSQSDELRSYIHGMSGPELFDFLCKEISLKLSIDSFFNRNYEKKDI